MTTPLERSLATTLEAEVLNATPPEQEFYSAVHRRTRQRRSRRRALVAGSACALALAVGGAAVAVANVRDVDELDNEPVAVATVDTTKLPDFANLADPRKVWPRAVSTLPNRLPDGMRYSLIGILPNNRYLVIPRHHPSAAGPDSSQGAKPSRSGERAEPSQPPTSPRTPVLGVFDVGRKTFTPLSDSHAAAGTKYYSIDGAGVVGDYVMWWAGVTRDHQEHEIWSAKLNGGAPRKLVTLATTWESSGAPNGFSVAGNAVVWRVLTQEPGAEQGVWRSVGIYRLGPTGGPPALVRGSAGFSPGAGTHLFNWADTNPGHPKSAPADGELWNLVTGERRRWTRNPAATYLTCGPLWCGGTSATQRAVIQQLDGSGYVELPSGFRFYPAGDGRLAYGWRERRRDADENAAMTIVWDLSTGRAAKLPRVPVPLAFPIAASYGAGASFHAWEQDGKVVLLDYAKIK